MKVITLEKYYLGALFILLFITCKSNNEGYSKDLFQKTHSNQLILNTPDKSEVVTIGRPDTNISISDYIVDRYNYQDFYLTVNNKYLYDRDLNINSLNHLDIIDLKLKLRGGVGSRFGAMNPDKYCQSQGVSTSDNIDSFLPGLNIRVRCNMPGCNGKTSVNRLGFGGNVGGGDNFSSCFDMGGVLQDVICRHCGTKRMGSLDEDEEERITIDSIIFDRCKFDWKGKIHKDEKKWKKDKRVYIQEKVELKKNMEYRSYSEEDFMDYEYCRVRTGRI